MISISQEGGHPQHRAEEAREQQGEIVEGQRQCGGTAQANHLHILSGQKKTAVYMCQQQKHLNAVLTDPPQVLYSRIINAMNDVIS